MPVATLVSADSGLTNIKISWSAPTGANTGSVVSDLAITTYDVYSNGGSGDTFSVLAQDLTDTDYDDTSVSGG